jgi:superfamily II DNA or RNA helicase
VWMPVYNDMPEQDKHQDQARSAEEECSRLRQENARLREVLAAHGIAADESLPHIRPIETASFPGSGKPSTPQSKIALFRSLFRGREDVYAVRWERNGKSGYSPACVMDWRAIHSARPEERKKIGRKTRSLLSLTDDAIRDHLTGKQTLGIYPLLPEETCQFLAADFDKKSWMVDAAAFAEACRRFGVPAAVERSRSGNGAHAWMFFDRPVRALDARKLGCGLLTRAMEKRHQIGLDSYDRLFPSQDTMPKGGFGNLIALPLQKLPRNLGHSVFLDESFHPYADQWAFLESIHRIPIDALAALLQEIAPEGNMVGVHLALPDEQEGETPWLWRPSRNKKDSIITEPFPPSVRVVLSNLLYIEKQPLPSAMLDRLLRIAAFQNPEFYKAQALRLSTYGKPRVISCGESFPEHIGLPRGCLEEVVAVFKAHRVKVELRDERTTGQPIHAVFHAELRPEQQEAVTQMLVHDQGILCAPTAFGKTVVGASLIASRAVNTLVLVHRRQLMDQWRERLSAFLSMPIDHIGQVGGGKSKRTGAIDVAVIQGLQRKGGVKDFVADYGQIIVDECHHLSAFTFEQVLRQARAKYIIGLTATPIRKDGHHPILFMQCGPIRYHRSAKKDAAFSCLEHKVIPRYTNFNCNDQNGGATIQDICAVLVSDKTRNDLIVQDLKEALAAGRSPLVLTSRTEHLKHLAECLSGFLPWVFILKGGMGIRQRKKLAESIAATPPGEPRVLLATGSYIGEGFDDPRLDTLFLAMPVSWKGTLQQYVGRLHRLYENKTEVRVYDYADVQVPMLARMYKKRLAGYAALGYILDERPQP